MMKKHYTICITIAIFIGLINCSGRQPENNGPKIVSTEVLNGEDYTNVYIVTTFTDSIKLAFRLLEDNTLAVYKILNEKDFKCNVCIPKSIDYNGVEYLITGIWDEAFYGCSGLTSVTIPNSVNIIGNSAFYGCTGLTSIEIPNSVNTIYPGAFYGCSGLTSIEIPNSVNAIGDGAFYGCSGLKSITIPNSVTHLGSSLFADCTGLSTITLPNTLSNLSENDFSGCINLTSVSIQSPGFFFTESVYITHKELDSIFDDMFPDCNKLQRSNVKMAPGYIEGHLTYVDGSKNNLIHCSESVSDHLTLPNTVTSIGKVAFYGCRGLTSVTIPNSVTSIGDYAFYGCSSLTSVTIPNSVTSIGDHVFSDCSGLTSVTIPNSITSIGDHAFSDCSGLTSVTIPNSVTSIGRSAFYGCSGLTSVTIPNPVFFNRFNDVDEDLIRIQRKEVLNKQHESRILFTQKHIDRNWDDSVDDCIVASFEDGTIIMFKLLDNNKLEVKNFLGNHRNKDAFPNHKDFIGDVCIPMTVEHKGEKYSVTSIGTKAFEDCSGLTSVTIGNSVTSIGYRAFAGCRGLTSVVIPNSVTSIGDGAFAGCRGLTSVVIPNSVTSIGDGAFEDCSGLTSVTIGKSVTSIGEFAFAGCSALTSVTIPNSVTSIGDDAFDGVNNIVYSGSATGVPWGAQSLNRAVKDY